MSAAEWTPGLPFGMLRLMAKQFGGVEFHSSGRWCVRFRLEGRTYRSFSAPLGRRRIPYPTRELAKEVLEEIRAEIKRGIDPIAAVAPYLTRGGLHSVAVWWEKWGEALQERADAGQLSKTRARVVAGHLTRGYLDSLQRLPIHNVEFANLEDLQAALLEQGLSPKSVHHVLADVRTFYGWLRRRKMVAQIPEIPTTRVPAHIPDIPTREEQDARLGGIPERERGYFLARGLMGVRDGEAARALVEDYRRGKPSEGGHFDSDELTVREKGGGIRVLLVPREVAAWVRENRPAMAEAGTPLFPNPKTGEPWRESARLRAWAAMEKRLGLSHVKPNEALRHCFGTRKAEELLSAGYSQAEARMMLMPYMGHSSIKTSERYVRFAAARLDR